MAAKYHNTTVSFWIFLLLVTIETISHGNVAGLMDRSKFPPKPRGTWKTIEVPEDGDLIDCINIYKQPAFDHPLISKKHVIQLEPSPETFREFNKKLKGPLPHIKQNWHKYGECPKGTVPIRRVWVNTNISHRSSNEDMSTHEYASAKVPKNTYYGGSARLNVWNPPVGGNEFSLSQLWAVAEPGTDELQSIEAGWMVYPRLYGNAKTRLFTFWTNDAYDQVKCYNTDCPGFIQTDFTYSLGSAIEPSVVQGHQEEIYIALSRDRNTSRWWLKFQDSMVGYWPPELFSTLKNSADLIEFGGEIINLKPKNRHTDTKMGSGNFPSAGLGKASYVKNAQVTNKFEFVVDADLTPVITNHNCYDLRILPFNREDRVHFLFGGPGFDRKKCR